MPKRNDGDTDQPLAAGWYPDPWSATGEGERYFDGKKWGSSARPLGRHTQTPPAPGASVTSIKSGKRRKAGRFKLPRVKGGGSSGGWAGFRNKYGPLLILAGLVLLVWGVPKLLHSGDSKPEVFVEPTTTPTTTPNRPLPSSEEAASPLGVPAPAPTAPGKFEVSLHQPTDPATPVAWDPCRPIHYVVNLTGAPADGLSMIKSAIARVHTATGLQFVYDGPTTETPDKQRADYLPRRYDATRWAPVLFAWSDEKAFPELAGYVAGVTYPGSEYTPEQHLVLVSGEIVLDRRELSLAATLDRRLARAIILHEVGHLVGLGHTNDKRQLMYSETQRSVFDFAAGDLRGLAKLGTQSCYPDI